MAQDLGEVQRGGRRGDWQHPATTDEPLLTPRLELVPVIADDLGAIRPHRGAAHQFARLAAARLADQEGAAQRNWTARRRRDGRAVGVLQAAFSDQGRAAELAWAVGVPWQGQGIASEAARAVVAWPAASTPGHKIPPHKGN